MKRNVLLPGLSAAAVALSACAHPGATQPSKPTAAADCGRLRGEIVQTEQARHAALAQQQDAWKSAVPLLIAGQHFGGRSAISGADKRIVELNAELSRQGCVRQLG